MQSNISIIEGFELDAQKLFNNNTKNANMLQNLSEISANLNTPEYSLLLQTVKSHFNPLLKQQQEQIDSKSHLTDNCRKKMRPYLVRRGGGVKVRGETSKSICENVEPKQLGNKKFKCSSVVKPSQVV